LAVTNKVKTRMKLATMVFGQRAMGLVRFEI